MSRIAHRVQAEMSSSRERSLLGPQCVSESVGRSWTAASSLFIKLGLFELSTGHSLFSQLLRSCFIIHNSGVLIIPSGFSHNHFRLLGTSSEKLHYRFTLKALWWAASLPVLDTLSLIYDFLQSVYINCAVQLQFFAYRLHPFCFLEFWFLADPLHSSVLSPKFQVQTQREAEGELWNSWIPRPWSCELRFCLLPHWHVECGRHRLHVVSRPPAPRALVLNRRACSIRYFE